MAIVDPTGLVSTVVSLGLQEVVQLAKKAIHCKEKCNKLEALLCDAQGYVAHVCELEAASSNNLHPEIQNWLDKFKIAINNAETAVARCQALGIAPQERLKVADIIEESSQMIQKLLDAAPRTLLVQVWHQQNQTPLPKNVVPRAEQHEIPPEQKIFGVEEKFKQVLSHLLDEEPLPSSPVSSSSSHKWVGIYGMGGVGKTLLAKRVFNNAAIKMHFDALYWLTFGQSPQVEVKQQELFNNIIVTAGEATNKNIIDNEQISMLLFSKRCLLVLDDVWKAGDMDLFDVVQENNGSRILITSRKATVVNSRGAVVTELCVLGEEDSTKLFKVHAFPMGGEIPVEECDFMAEVVKRCGGLPLVLKVIGRRMAGQRGVVAWRDVLDKLGKAQLNDIDEDQKLLQSLKLGYDALPEKYQQPFLSFAAFPEDQTIWFEDLFKIWKGEGLVSDMDEASVVVEGLKEHALIEDVEDNEYKIHDILLDLAHHIAKGQKSWYSGAGRPHNDSQIQDALNGNHKRISLITCGIQKFPSPTRASLNTNTICLLLDRNWGLKALPSRLPSCFRNLQVLCLRNTGIKNLPRSIGDLRNLATLDLRGNYSLESVPSSLSRLINLSYLDLSYCHNIQQFPVDALTKLLKLTHLNTEGCSTNIWECHQHASIWHQFLDNDSCLNRFDRQSGCSFRGRPSHLHLDGLFQRLRSLEVLKIFTCLKLDTFESIGQLSWLKELLIRSRTGLEVPSSLQSITTLEFLELEGITGLADAAGGYDWSKHVRLRILKLRPSLVIDADFRAVNAMKNLRELDLGRWNLEALAADRFPNLKSLQLWRCPKLAQLRLSGAACLEILDLQSLPKLERIDFDASQFQQLRTLSIRGCDLLQQFPAGLGEPDAFPLLEKLKVQQNLPEMHPGALPSLEHLRIHKCNKIQQLPGSITLLTSLTWLRLEDLPSLQQLPENLGLLPLLRELNVEGCDKIQQLPGSIALLTSLTHLSLENLPSLQQLPENLGLLPLLRELNVGGCDKIQQLPGSITLLTSLTRLRLANLPSLQQLPENLGLLPLLTGLNVEGCDKIQQLPGSITLLTSLTWLRLVNLPSLQQLPENLGLLPELRNLSLEGCHKISTIPTLGSSSYLKRLNLEGTSVDISQLPQRLQNATKPQKLRFRC